MVESTLRRRAPILYLFAPALLIGLLSLLLYWRLKPDLGVSESSFSGKEVEIVLGWSTLLACLCGWELLSLSRSVVHVRDDLSFANRRHEQDELEQAAQAMHRYAIFMLDPQGYIASWDRDAERLVGLRSIDAMERHISVLYGEEDSRQGKPAHDLSTAATDGRFDDDRWLTRRDGFRFRAAVAIIAIRDPSGELCGFTHVIREEV